MGTHYIKNKQFEETICRLQEAKIKMMDNPKKYENEYLEIQGELAMQFYEMTKNLLTKYKIKHVEEDDLLQEGVLIAMQRVERFQHNYINKQGKKSKAFNYITTCLLNHFYHLYKVEKNQNALRGKYYEHLVNEVEEVSRDYRANGPSKAVYRKTPNSN